MNALCVELEQYIENMDACGMRTDAPKRVLNALAQIQRLAELLIEKRSDISDELYSILDGNNLHEDAIESRFIHADMPIGAGQIVNIEYDTLTTLLHWKEDGDDKWIECDNHDYSD